MRFEHGTGIRRARSFRATTGTAAGQIGARTETAPGASEHQHARRAFVAHPVHRVDHLFDHAHVERVHHLRPVDGEGRNAFGFFEQDVGIAHDGLPLAVTIGGVGAPRHPINQPR